MPTNKTLSELIIEAFPELAETPNEFRFGSILLQNDLDGTGDYIAKWEYSKPLPADLESYLRA
jgi:hypothetical protein